MLAGPLLDFNVMTRRPLRAVVTRGPLAVPEPGAVGLVLAGGGARGLAHLGVELGGVEARQDLARAHLAAGLDADAADQAAGLEAQAGLLLAADQAGGADVAGLAVGPGADDAYRLRQGILRGLRTGAAGQPEGEQERQGKKAYGHGVCSVGGGFRGPARAGGVSRN